jgi:DNA-binding NarL/FixJ family response regulator
MNHLQAMKRSPHQPVMPKPVLLQTLSPTEHELLNQLAQGHSYKQIAQHRQRSAATVRNQIHNAYRKLGVSNRIEALRLLLAAEA